MSYLQGQAVVSMYIANYTGCIRVLYTLQCEVHELLILPCINVILEL